MPDKLLITAEKIAELLNDAKANDYDVSGWTNEEIATDLICYADECESASVEQLDPFIQAWKDKQCASIPSPT